MKKQTLLCIFIFSIAISCGKENSEDTDTVVKDNTVVVTDGVVCVNPYEYYNAFRNPMKGWREYFGPGVDKKRSIYPYPYGTLNKEYMQWNMMEEVESDGVDKVIEYSNHRWQGVEDINMKIVPRPYIVWMEPYNGGYAKNKYNSSPDDLNGWHWPLDIPMEIRSSDDNTPSTGGYFDPTFIDRVTKLVKKLAQAWDNDPRVAYVEMGLIGEFGEHHDPSIRDFWKPHTQNKHVAGRTWIPGIEEALGDVFTQYFKNKKVMVRYAYDFQDYDFGYYWDSFAFEYEDERGYNWYMRRGDFWKRQVMGGEVTWAYSTYADEGIYSFEDLLKSDKRRRDIINQVRALHVNHLGGVTWADWTKDENFLHYAADIQKIMGYHFVLKDFKYPMNVSAGETIDISFGVLNTGSSPFYYDWPVEISLIDPQTKEVAYKTILKTPEVSKWMPGDDWSVENNRYLVEPLVYQEQETITIPSDLTPGKYAIAIAVLDPAGNLPSLRFAAFNYWNGGRHPMGYIGIGQKISDPKILLSEFDDIQSDTSLHYEL